MPQERRSSGVSVAFAHNNGGDWNWNTDPVIHVDTVVNGSLDLDLDSSGRIANWVNSQTTGIFNPQYGSSFNYNIPGYWSISYVSQGNIDVSDAAFAIGVYGQTYSSNSGGKKLKAFIALNYDESWQTGSTAPAAGSGDVDQRSVLLHEFGHSFGVHHLNSNMCPHSTLLVMAEFLQREKTCRTLQSADKTHLNDIY